MAARSAAASFTALTALTAVAAGAALPAVGVGTAAAASSPRPAQRSASRPPAEVLYDGRADLRAFADEVSARHGWSRGWALQQLRGARRLPRVQQLIMPPPAGVAKNWGAYRDRFVEPRRITAGMAFWQTHHEALRRAEAEYGVPPEIVVGIIGVETYYGRITGDFRVVDALATLAFDFPSGRSDRSAFFRGELEELLLLARRERVRANAFRGSYAGAIGWPQFMPGSINRHAVDFDGDGHIDLQHSVADAIGSVARYLQRHGWQSGMATHYAVDAPQDDAARATLLAPDILPSFSAEQFAQHGARLPPPGQAHGGPLALVRLDNGGAEPTYLAGTQNFFAITRYNWSSYYALAVIELGRAVKEARAAAGARINPSP